MPAISVFDPSVSFMKMFRWIVEEQEQIDIWDSDKLTIITTHIPNYNKAVEAYTLYNATPDYYQIPLIEYSFDFIWQGLEKEIKNSDPVFLTRFATELINLKETRDRYESGIIYLLAEHIRLFAQATTDKIGLLSRKADGTTCAQAIAGIEGTVFLIDSATQLVNEQLQTMPMRLASVEEGPAANNKRQTREITQSTPSLSPDELHPYLYIPSILQTRLYKTLSEHTLEDQHEALELLLEKGHADRRVWIKLAAGAVAYIFKQAREADSMLIKGHKTEQAAWVAAYFDWGKKKRKHMCYDTVHNIFRETAPVSKTNQIRLKL